MGVTFDIMEINDNNNNSEPRYVWQQRRLSSSTTDDEDCEPLSDCGFCTSGQLEGEPMCRATGLVQRFKCKQEQGEPIDVFKSCKRTSADEEFLMIRLQVFCVLMGSISVMVVRKHKMQGGSLFDRRSRRTSNMVTPNDGETIEFTPMVGQNEETKSLKPIDVV